MAKSDREWRKGTALMRSDGLYSGRVRPVKSSELLLIYSVGIQSLEVNGQEVMRWTVYVSIY